MSAPPDLTPKEFEALLALLDPDRERAGERYVVLRHRLVRLFEWRGCEFADELADQTIVRVARRAPDLEIKGTDPFGYFCGVAHLVQKEVWRSRERERRAHEEGSRDSQWLALRADREEDDEDEADAARRLAALRRCLADMTADQRELIRCYYQGEDRIRSRQELSRQLGIALNALRIRAYRLRRDLAACIAGRLGSRPG